MFFTLIYAMRYLTYHKPHLDHRCVHCCHSSLRDCLIEYFYPHRVNNSGGFQTRRTSFKHVWKKIAVIFQRFDIQLINLITSSNTYSGKHQSNKNQSWPKPNLRKYYLIELLCVKKVNATCRFSITAYFSHLFLWSA